MFDKNETRRFPTTHLVTKLELQLKQCRESLEYERETNKMRISNLLEANKKLKEIKDSGAIISGVDIKEVFSYDFNPFQYKRAISRSDKMAEKYDKIVRVLQETVTMYY